MTSKVQVNHFYGEIAYEVEVSEQKRKEILTKYPAPKFSEGVSHFNKDEFNDGTNVTGAVLLINDYSIETTSNGGQYLKMSFINNNGSVGAKMWDKNGSVAHYSKVLEEKTIFWVSGKVQEFPKGSGNKNIQIDSLEVYEGEINAFDLLPSTKVNLEDYIVELYSYIEECDEEFRTIGFAALDKYWSEFSMKPAAKGHHHSYLGGLLKHTVGLMRIARYIMSQDNPFKPMMRLLAVAQRQYNTEIWGNVNAEAQLNTRKMVWNGSIDHLNTVFNQFSLFREKTINVSALTISILFHDMGKILEYMHVGEDAVKKFSWVFPNTDLSALKDRKGTGITMDTFGLALGHIPLGVMMFEQIRNEVEVELPIEDVVKVSNSLLAHHGKAEWGSPSNANYPEAVLIHFVDYLDSRWESADEIK